MLALGEEDYMKGTFSAPPAHSGGARGGVFTNGARSPVVEEHMCVQSPSGQLCAWVFGECASATLPWSAEIGRNYPGRAEGKDN